MILSCVDQRGIRESAFLIRTPPHEEIPLESVSFFPTLNSSHIMTNISYSRHNHYCLVGYLASRLRQPKLARNGSRSM
jgi:hypothetical protein